MVIRCLVYLLGTPLKKLKNWKKIRNDFGQLGKQNIKARIDKFNPNTVNSDMSENVERMLRGMTLDSVEEVSGALGTFYAWAKCNAQYNYDDSVMD